MENIPVKSSTESSQLLYYLVFPILKFKTLLRKILERVATVSADQATGVILKANTTTQKEILTLNYAKSILALTK